MSRFIRPVLIAALAMAPVTAAQAQDWRGTPVFGQVRLEAGFTPDPHVVELTAGGGTDAGRLAGGRCNGNIGHNPDYVLRYTAGDMPLNIRVTSSEDTTLVIRDPGGSWQCNDDANDLNPEVGFPRPASGNYHIWVGTFNENTANARLEISELASSEVASGSTIDMSQEANFGEVILRAGFTPDPHTVTMAAGGSVSASSVDGQCSGYVSQAPDYELTYRANGSNPLTFTFASDGDTTLMINAPDGSFYCDDDSDGDLNPRVHFNRAQEGVYDVWVGTISGEIESGTLSISEIQ
ncbi:hypothetical protein [Brevundimonas sp.]|uniref:hypothetical protein n=1 Tax=Brevundimonas sp. TaxID=1871086 RepID=UPI00289E3809|nr:hypothetical protein [Brevundimonas sp.]